MALVAAMVLMSIGTPRPLIDETPGRNLETGTATASPETGGTADTSGDSALVDELLDSSDPERWLTHEDSGHLYRRSTHQERSENGWLNGTYLVHGPELAPTTSGVPSVNITLPYNDTRVEMAELSLARTISNRTAAILNLSGGSHRYDFTSYVYEVEDSSNVDGRLFATDRGSYYGEFSIEDRQIAVMAEHQGWVLDEVPAETEIGWNDTYAMRITECLKGCATWTQDTSSTDDTSDEGADGTDASSDSDSSIGKTEYNFHLLGEVKWCTKHKDDWDAKLTTLAHEIETGFADTSGVMADLDPQWVFCWFASNDDEANKCDTGEWTCSHDHAHLGDHWYSYNGCDSKTKCYKTCAWDHTDCGAAGGPAGGNDLQHHSKHWDFPAASVVQVIHQGMQVNPDGDDVCGRASFSDGSTPGVSVSYGLPAPERCSVGFTSTHEVGHNFDAVHEDNEYAGETCTVNGVDYNVWTVMANESTVSGGLECRANFFSTDNKDTINWCVDRDDCPRAASDDDTVEYDVV